ncbi:MAG: M50 family metallopeptidase [Clostridia bacterium]|nr:M50 family metallopeptidase [Clostridia bacterium]
MKKSKKTSLKKYLPMLFFVLIGAVCGVLMVEYISRAVPERPLVSLVILFIAMYAAILMQLILHEFGHLVFGLISGYKFGSFRILSFMLIRDEGKLKLKKMTIAGTGGQCLMSPPDMVDGKLPVMLYNLGGSVMNVVFGGVFMALHFGLSAYPLLSAVMLMFGLIGFAIALMNGIPMRMGEVDNDGFNAFSLGKDPQALRAFWVQMKVNQQISRGVRLKDMPEEWFALPSDEAMKNSMVAAIGVFACNRLMDEGRLSDADTLMEKMLNTPNGMVGVHRRLMVCDRIFIELLTQNRSDVIKNMLTSEQLKFMKAMKSFPSVLRTEYALELLGNKDNVKAESFRAQFERFAKSYPYQSDIEAERELMDMAKNKWESEETK